MITSRKEGRIRKYLFLDKWMTSTKLVELDGCNICEATLRGRLRNASHNPLFDTIEGCLYTPKKKIDCEGILELGAGRKSFMASRDLLDQIEFDKLMPVGSLSHEVR